MNRSHRKLLSLGRSCGGPQFPPLGKSAKFSSTFRPEGNSQDWAWTLLDDAVGVGTKDGQVESIAAAHSQNDEVRIRLRGGVDDLLVRLADSQTRLQKSAIPGGGWQQALELLYHLGGYGGEVLVQRETRFPRDHKFMSRFAHCQDGTARLSQDLFRDRAEEDVVQAVPTVRLER